MPENCKKPDLALPAGTQQLQRATRKRRKTLQTGSSDGQEFLCGAGGGRRCQRKTIRATMCPMPKQRPPYGQKTARLSAPLVLFRKWCRTAYDAKMRRQAQAEWRFATRGFDEDKLLTAAQTAFDHGFYDMAVNSAERTTANSTTHCAIFRRLKTR